MFIFRKLARLNEKHTNRFLSIFSIFQAPIHLQYLNFSFHYQKCFCLYLSQPSSLSPSFSACVFTDAAEMFLLGGLVLSHKGVCHTYLPHSSSMPRRILRSDVMSIGYEIESLKLISPFRKKYRSLIICCSRVK